MNILLADDQPRIRFALRILLEQQPGWLVVGEARDANELLDCAGEMHPDLVILDGELPGMDNGRYVAAVRSLSPGVCIIALGEDGPHRDPAARPDAYASKANPPERLLNLIRDCQNRVPPGQVQPAGREWL